MHTQVGELAYSFFVFCFKLQIWKDRFSVKACLMLPVPAAIWVRTWLPSWCADSPTWTCHLCSLSTHCNKHDSLLLKRSHSLLSLSRFSFFSVEKQLPVCVCRMLATFTWHPLSSRTPKTFPTPRLVPLTVRLHFLWPSKPTKALFLISSDCSYASEQYIQ